MWPCWGGQPQRGLSRRRAVEAWLLGPWFTSTGHGVGTKTLTGFLWGFLAVLFTHLQFGGF